jgi:hypothetical protein
MSADIDNVSSKSAAAQLAFLLGDPYTRDIWDHREKGELWQLVAWHSEVDPHLLRDWTHLKSVFSALRRARSDRIQESMFCYVDGVQFFAPEPDEEDPRLDLADNIEWAAIAAQTGRLPSLRRNAGDVETWTVSRAAFATYAAWQGLRPAKGFSGRGQWPWGAHSTRKLEQLAAGGECWRDYDRRRPHSAPRPQRVRAALRDAGACKTDIALMVSILRDPELRPGPHPTAPPEAKE